MSDKKEITLTVNDIQVKGNEGDTILEICRANDIYIPPLCYLEGLSNVGACRLCVVEIEGERRINPACTYPARDGLVVKTHTEQLEGYRRLILELMFTERNHFCFFCEASGDCELQALAYRYQIDHMRYPYTFPSLPTDTLNDFMVIDHNRCILCGRCVRTCSEVVANHTLDFSKRGWRLLIAADLNQSLGESSCISCGACTQACPTGAIFSKVSAYRGRTSEGNVVNSVCEVCGLGCPIDVLVKDNNVVRIDSADLTGPKGMLCAKGRFQQVCKESSRITTPLHQHRARVQRPVSWEYALGLVADKLKECKDRYGADSIAAFASSLCSNEVLEAFDKLMRHSVGTGNIDTIDGDSYRVIAEGIRAFSKNGQGLEIEGTIESILDADCLLVVGANPLQSHPVIGSWILRARDRNRTGLVVIDSRPNPFGFRADIRLRPIEGSEEALIKALTGLAVKKTKSAKKPSGSVSLSKAAETTGLDASLIEQAAAKLSSASKLVIIYGEGIINQKKPAIVTRLLNLARQVGGNGKNVISLKPRGNSRGAWELGLANRNGKARADAKLVYVLLADDELEAEEWLEQFKGIEFMVVQASYHSPLSRQANVVLPSTIWAEREGTYVSLDGRASVSSLVLNPPSGVKGDIEVITQLAGML
ncbi:MAG: molybdopterin-dependent oxidoreductase [Dehalococcoidia bacterium]|nr:molybdopterin-dependent oxidoreductase [Dehalococcoidia bacterium]